MRTHKNLSAYVALLIVCLVWGTAYFALRIGVKTFPPFLFSAIRQVIAGLLLLAVLAIKGKLKFNKRIVYHQFVSGVLILALGNGIIGWCERIIPSGLAALILSLIPVFVVLINYLSGVDKRKPDPILILGLVLGCLAIALIFNNNLKDFAKSGYFDTMLIAFAACFAIAIGSVYTKSHSHDNDNILQNAALQLISAGMALFVLSSFMDDFSEIKSISTSSIWALAYLIVFGSAIAYPCYVYTLKQLPIGIASVYAYVNPFIAIILGFVFLNETLTMVTILALSAALGGVYSINKGYLRMSAFPKIKNKKENE